MSKPLVTAVMITGKTVHHEKFCRVALRCFREQTWPNKNLVIVSDRHYGLFEEELGSDVELVELPSKRQLSDLRNAGLDAASGDYVIQWDDDDWHNPDRIQVQMEALSSNKLACLLQYQIRYSFRNNAAYIKRQRIFGTILHRATKHRYDVGLRRHEDTHFFKKHFGSSYVMLGKTDRDADHYIRMFHGRNTFGEPHIMGRWRGKSNHWQLLKHQRPFLAKVLHDYYGITAGHQKSCVGADRWNRSRSQ